MNDVPEELAAEIPDPKHITVWVDEEDTMTFMFGGMGHFECLGRLRSLVAAMEAGDIENVEEE